MADITKRKRAKDVLRPSEEHLRLIIDTIPTMAWTVRPDGAVDFYQSAFAGLFWPLSRRGN